MDACSAHAVAISDGFVTASAVTLWLSLTAPTFTLVALTLLSLTVLVRETKNQKIHVEV
jgi:hypothetical protein